ncbi:hypothetical protein D3C72_2008200 [compost metagenome]
MTLQEWTLVFGCLYAACLFLDLVGRRWLIPLIRLAWKRRGVASGCEVAAIACGAITSERVAKVWPVIRSAAWDSMGTAASTAAASRERARRRDTVEFRWKGGDPIFAAAAIRGYRA